MKRVCIFCGSSPGARIEYTRAAQVMGAVLADHELELIYGGGQTGLMGVLADAVLTAGGHVIGVIPQALMEKEVAHKSLDELIVTRSMHERKEKMADLADAFVALPGGFGTYDEFCEIITWAQLGIHSKAIGLLNVHGFYDGLLTFFDHAVGEQFIRQQHHAMIQISNDPAQLLDMLAAYRPMYTPKWVGHEDR